jgi:hypothetical protein
MADIPKAVPRALKRRASLKYKRTDNLDDPSIGPPYSLGTQKIQSHYLGNFITHITTFRTWLRETRQTLQTTHPEILETCDRIFNDSSLVRALLLVKASTTCRTPHRLLLLRTIQRFHNLLVLHRMHIDTTFWFQTLRPHLSITYVSLDNGLQVLTVQTQKPPTNPISTPPPPPPQPSTSPSPPVSPPRASTSQTLLLVDEQGTIDVTDLFPGEETNEITILTEQIVNITPTPDHTPTPSDALDDEFHDINNYIEVELREEATRRATSTLTLQTTTAPCNQDLPTTASTFTIT